MTHTDFWSCYFDFRGACLCFKAKVRVPTGTVCSIFSTTLGSCTNSLHTVKVLQFTHCIIYLYVVRQNVTRLAGLHAQNAFKRMCFFLNMSEQRPNSEFCLPLCLTFWSAPSGWFRLTPHWTIFDGLEWKFSPWIYLTGCIESWPFSISSLWENETQNKLCHV